MNASVGGMSAVADASVRLLPPSLIHQLRARSFPRLFRMTGNPGNRGFGRVLRKRIRDLVVRERTLVEKAITVAYMGSYLVDHIVQAEKLAVRLLEQRELSEAEEHQFWEQAYGSVLLRLCQELPDQELLLEEIVRLERYDRLPACVFAFRTRHWRRIDGLLRRLPEIPIGVRPGVGVMARVEEVLYSRRSPRRKAMAVVLLASLLADRSCWAEHEPWPDAYQETMIDLYPLLVRHGEVLEELVRLGEDG
jgi:hypothetical protein